MTIGSRQRINATQGSITIKLDGSEINKVDTVKSLGVHIDKQLSWSTHIEKLTKKIASAIGALKRIRGLIVPKVVGSNPTVARHIFQACPVWIYTQSNITQASY
jgi:hypothetical protein